MRIQTRIQSMNKISESELVAIQRLVLIGEDGENLGVYSGEKANEMIKERELDAVLVADKDVPVVKAMDYDKFLYREKKNRKKRVVSKIKEIRFKNIAIDQHDLQIKVRQMEKFLSSGNKVKINVISKGRARERGEMIVDFVKDILSKIDFDYKTDNFPKPDSSAKTFSVVISP